MASSAGAAGVRDTPTKMAAVRVVMAVRRTSQLSRSAAEKPTSAGAWRNARQP